MRPKKQIRSTNAQLIKLVEYMALNRKFANGVFKGPQRSRKMDAQWLELKELLKKFGPDKSIEQWKQTWRDLKRKARRSNTQSTDNIVDIPAVPLETEVILATIGHDSPTGIGPEESPIEQMTWRDLKSKAWRSKTQATDDTIDVPEVHLETKVTLATSGHVSPLGIGPEESPIGQRLEAAEEAPPSDDVASEDMDDGNIVAPVAAALCSASSRPLAGPPRPRRRRRRLEPAGVPGDLITLQREHNSILNRLCDLLQQSNDIQSERNNILMQRNRLKQIEIPAPKK